MTTADRAEAALAGLKKRAFDAAVADADLPDATGEQLATSLRARDPRLARRTLFLARDPYAPSVKLLRRRAVVLPKPLALSELIAALVGLGVGRR